VSLGGESLTSNIKDKIDVYYSSMSKGQKRIADYINSNYEKASFMTAAALGEATGVSESTVVRFASYIGFDGYPELQKNLQETVKSRLTSVQRMEAANNFDGEDFIERAFTADIEMIKKTRESVSREAFVGAVDAINKAKKIYILGVRSSASIASFASFYMSLIYDVVLVDTSAVSEMFEQMIRISSDDLVIAISFPRYSNQTVKALKFAQSRGASIISITDGEMSPIAKYATYLLVAQSSMVSFVDSLVAPLSLVNALIAAGAGKRQEEVQENLNSLEKMWDEYHVYRTDGEE
jgi:DNA-binding MurR/RpiR family transcriptional regulator